jgi:hypothetical protein
VYALLNETDEDRGLRRLAEWIARRGGTVTARDVQRGCRWLSAAGAAEAALGELVRSGAGRWVDVPTTHAGGRPTREFQPVDVVDSDTTPFFWEKTRVSSTSTVSTVADDTWGTL